MKREIEVIYNSEQLIRARRHPNVVEGVIAELLHLAKVLLARVRRQSPDP